MPFLGLLKLGSLSRVAPRKPCTPSGPGQNDMLVKHCVKREAAFQQSTLALLG